MKMYPIQVGFLSESHEETGHECQGGCEECSCGGGSRFVCPNMPDGTGKP